MIKHIADLIIGTEVEDLESALEYVYFDEGDYPYEFRIAKCKCGCEEFVLEQDPCKKDEAARRVCWECDETHYICDSRKRWGERWAMNTMCGCGSGAWNIGVVFSLFEDGGEVRKVTVVARCCECNFIDYICEWEIDYSPSRHLLEMA